ncbi:MAG: flagellar hook-basal body complex protein [Xanthobacteraceae bacterium]
MGSLDAIATAVSGLLAQSSALQNISGNIANVSTTAFKSTNTSFQDFMDAGKPQQVSGFVQGISTSTNTLQGTVQTSTVGTNMAINGDGYFTVEKPSSVSSTGQPIFDGSQVYTRRGDFQPDANGYLVNGAGYYLMGSPVNPATGQATGGAPQLLQFGVGTIQAAQATTQIQYSANLASQGASATASGLLDPAGFEANPIAGAAPQAAVIGTGATLSPDAVAVATGSANISALPVGGVGGTLQINGSNIGVAATDSAATIVTNINAQTGTTGVTATLNASNQLVLTGVNATTNVAVGAGSSAAVLGQLGLAAGTTNATNLLTQNAVSPGQTLTFQVGANPALTVTFGTGVGQVQTLAQLNTALGALAGGAASANAANGNISVAAGSPTAQITVGGSATASVFGIQNSLALPANGTVVGNDVSTFLNQSLPGGSVTGYDAAGTPVNVQLQWAKVAGAPGGAGTWNLFYQTNASATGTQAAWQNVGTNFTFSSSGQMSPQISSLPISNLTVNGDSLGTVTLNFGTGGLTQFADPSGSVQVTQLSQNGAQAGSLKTLSIGSQGQVEGTFTNGRTTELAAVPLVSFRGESFLQQGDGGTVTPTAESGAAVQGASGTIVGNALEASNTSIEGQFTTMIMTQQAYSAITKVVTTSDQMLATVTNWVT